jgi:hypothetical protein
MKIIEYAIVVAAIVGTLSVVSAQTTNVILQTDFDKDAGEGNYTGSYGYTVAGTSAGSAAPNFSQAVTAGIGVDGTSANELSPDYTELATDQNWTNDSIQWAYAVAGDGTSFAGPITPITPTSALNSLVLSADLQLSGLLPGLTTADVSVTKVQFMDDDGDVLFDFTGDAGYVGSNFVHISLPLSSMTYAGDAMNPISDFTNPVVVASIASFTVEFAVQGLAGQIGGTGANQLSPPFGFTDTGGLVIDNIELAQIENTNSTPPPPMVEQPIWQANFDGTFPNNDGYGFSDRDGSPAATGVLSTNLTGGVGGSASLEYTVDLSGWSTSPPVSYSGFGIGATENPLPYELTSSSKASYRVYLSAKVGGVSPGNPNVSGNVDLSFYIPSGTEVYDLTSPLALSTNWQTYEFDGGTNMQVATWLTGAQQLFNQNVTNVNHMELQISVLGNPDVGSLFNYATNATVDIDNIKVVELVPGLAPITINRASSQTQIVWADPTSGGTAQLQSATNVAGPYLNVVGASSAATASPYIVPTGSQQQFFRTVWVP